MKPKLCTPLDALGEGSNDRANLIYDRNQAAQLAARIAWLVGGSGIEMGIRPFSKDEVELVIDLPTVGQVMWRIAIADLIGGVDAWPRYDPKHDGHNPSVRALRVDEFLRLFGK